MKTMGGYIPSPVPMPPVKIPPKDNVCDICAKEDVCSIKEEFIKAFKDILEIEGRTNVFVCTSVRCKKFLQKLPVKNIR